VLEASRLRKLRRVVYVSTLRRIRPLQNAPPTPLAPRRRTLFGGHNLYILLPKLCSEHLVSFPYTEQYDRRYNHHPPGRRFRSRLLRRRLHPSERSCATLGAEHRQGRSDHSRCKNLWPPMNMSMAKMSGHGAISRLPGAKIRDQRIYNRGGQASCTAPTSWRQSSRRADNPKTEVKSPGATSAEKKPQHPDGYQHFKIRVRPSAPKFPSGKKRLRDYMEDLWADGRARRYVSPYPDRAFLFIRRQLNNQLHAGRSSAEAKPNHVISTRQIPSFPGDFFAFFHTCGPWYAIGTFVKAAAFFRQLHGDFRLEAKSLGFKLDAFQAPSARKTL